LILLHLKAFDHAGIMKPFEKPDHLVPLQFLDIIQANPEGLNKLAKCEKHPGSADSQFETGTLQ
jgi:hypothetical protein